VEDLRVVIDAERELALRDFAHGMELPPPGGRTIESMISWLDCAISRLDIEDDVDALRYAGLVLDKQYLRMMQRKRCGTRVAEA
jgi:hypothetical protein